MGGFERARRLISQLVTPAARNFIDANFCPFFLGTFVENIGRANFKLIHARSSVESGVR